MVCVDFFYGVNGLFVVGDWYLFGLIFVVK